MITFNIGTAVNGVDNVLKAQDVFQTLQSVGFQDVSLVGVKSSDTELTLIIQAESHKGSGPAYDRFDHKRAVFLTCQAHGQDCIAYKINDTGYLVGPKAAEWGGEFNQEYFLE